jgi:RNA polymerase sigma factor (TIGR02999 family)
MVFRPKQTAAFRAQANGCPRKGDAALLGMLMSTSPDAITLVLARAKEDEAARIDLIGRLYDRFRQGAHLRLAHERPGHSLATTDLLHESLLRLWNSDELTKAASGNELFRAFARAMRQALVDRARRRKADKRGGKLRREPLDDFIDDVGRRSAADVLALDEALTSLADAFPREAEVLQMRFFGRYTVPEIAEVLGTSASTVERDARFAIAWLRDFLS